MFNSIGVLFCGCLILWVLFYSVGVDSVGVDSVGVFGSEDVFGFLRVSLILKMGLIPRGVVESKDVFYSRV